MLWVPSCLNKCNPPRSCPAEVHCQRDFKTVVSKAWMLGYVACTSATTGYSNSFQSLHDTLQSDNWEFWNVAPQRTNYFASVTGNDWSWPLNALHADAMDLEIGNYQRATYHTSILLFHSPKLASKAHCMAETIFGCERLVPQSTSCWWCDSFCTLIVLSTCRLFTSNEPILMYFFWHQ